MIVGAATRAFRPGKVANFGPVKRLRPFIALYLPTGRALPEAVWRRRHGGVSLLLWLHVPGVVLFGALAGRGVGHSLEEAAFPAVAALIAGWSMLGRNARSVAASLGLLMTSALLVHLSGGYIEMHFHFFVMVGVIALYQSWWPFLAAIAFVVVHHASAGVLDPSSVFNHAAGQRDPILWAAIHGGFVLAASAVSLTTWRLVEHQSLHDLLTGLPNRTLFGDRVAQALRLSSHSEAPVVVMFIDLDGFKQVNDSLGHAAGDELLSAVADRLRGAIRTGDCVARYGGDEFAILVSDVATMPEIVPIAERVRDAIAQPLPVHGHVVTPRASIGIAIGRGSDTPDALVRNADLAMYMAKSRGPGQYEFFDPKMRADVVNRVRLRQDLELAVETGSIAVAFQPIVELETGRMIGAEALARWTDPVRGIVPPGEFIPVADETDLIVRIGEQMIADVCERVAGWKAQGIVASDFTIAVNLSARQVRDPALVDFVADVLAETGLTPEHLVLEITEGVLLQDTDYVIGQLASLKALGIRLALDDFGTGYSSLGYLRRFPIDTLKIDRSFVQDLGKRDGDTAIVRTIMSLGNSLDLRTIAEGVEDLVQVEALADLGCRYAQGYHFARPLDPESFAAYATAAKAHFRSDAA
jgi:diguanylate cyclase (GGDEF)-like protein